MNASVCTNFIPQDSGARLPKQPAPSYSVRICGDLLVHCVRTVYHLSEQDQQPGGPCVPLLKEHPREPIVCLTTKYPAEEAKRHNMCTALVRL